MTTTLGWDIGGAHLKAALARDGRPAQIWQVPCPLWRDPDALNTAFATVLDEIASVTVDRHAVTMTGELVDAFASRREGVAILADQAVERLPSEVLFYADPEGLVDAETARAHPHAVASANWHASATVAAGAIDEGVFIDMGSTTTDLVPIANGAVRASGTGDRSRLVEGELVYQGFTRTALMAVEDRVPFAGRSVPVMNEHFATMADVQRIIGALDEADDQHAAADGGAKSLEGSRRRLARMIGADAEDADEGAWEWLAHAFAEAQIRHIHDAALRVLSRQDVSDDAPVIAAGVGQPVIRRLAARLDRGVVDFADLVDGPGDMRDPICRAAPAAALAVLAAR